MRTLYCEIGDSLLRNYSWGSKIIELWLFDVSRNFLIVEIFLFRDPNHIRSISYLIYRLCKLHLHKLLNRDISLLPPKTFDFGGFFY